MTDAPTTQGTEADRQARIDATIAACTECGGREFSKRADCDGCTSRVDEDLAEEQAAAAKMQTTIRTRLSATWAVLRYPFGWQRRKEERNYHAMSRAYGSWPDGEGL